MPENLKRKSYPFCGRLIIMQSRGARPLLDSNAQENFEGMVAINFPAMPDTIQLDRKTEYAVSTNPAFPDGIHQYRGTMPISLPIKFVLHSFDRDYCPKGAFSLLQVAAELQALTLPFGAEDVVVTVGQKAQEPSALLGDGTPKSNTPPKTDADVLANAAQETTLVGQLDSANYTLYPPATCYLELIITDRNSPGIACIGYVSDVSIILKGPWMRGPGISQNLPTSGEFGFTFVHHPGHGNAYNFAQNIWDRQSEKQAFAQTVRNKLFNTRHLLTETNYHGFNDKSS